MLQSMKQAFLQLHLAVGLLMSASLCTVNHDIGACTRYVTLNGAMAAGL